MSGLTRGHYGRPRPCNPWGRAPDLPALDLRSVRALMAARRRLLHQAAAARAAGDMDALSFIRRRAGRLHLLRRRAVQMRLWSLQLAVRESKRRFVRRQLYVLRAPVRPGPGSPWWMGDPPNGLLVPPAGAPGWPVRFCVVRAENSEVVQVQRLAPRLARSTDDALRAAVDAAGVPYDGYRGLSYSAQVWAGADGRSYVVRVSASAYALAAQL